MPLKPRSPAAEGHAASQNRVTTDSYVNNMQVFVHTVRIRCIFMEDFNNNKVLLYLVGLCGDRLLKSSMKNCANSRIHMEPALTLGSHSQSRTPTWRLFTALGVRLWTVGGNKRSWRKGTRKAHGSAGLNQGGRWSPGPFDWVVAAAVNKQPSCCSSSEHLLVLTFL